MSTTISFESNILTDYCQYKQSVSEKVGEQRLFAEYYNSTKLTNGNGSINAFWKDKQKELRQSIDLLPGDAMERYSRYAQARYTAEVEYRNAKKRLRMMRSDDSLVARISLWLESKFNRYFGKEVIS